MHVHVGFAISVVFGLSLRMKDGTRVRYEKMRCSTRVLHAFISGKFDLGLSCL